MIGLIMGDARSLDYSSCETMRTSSVGITSTLRVLLGCCNGSCGKS